MFLAFHPSQIQAQSHGAKLPLAVYESVYEGENADTAKEMQVDGEEPQLNIRFRELPYSVETGEAEMIGIDTIAKGSGTASASEIPSQGAIAAGQRRPEAIDKAAAKQDGSQPELSQEQEESMPSFLYQPLMAL